MYKLYQDLHTTSEKKLKNLQNLLDKSYQLLENLNGNNILILEPFNTFAEKQQQKNEDIYFEKESPAAFKQQEQITQAKLQEYRVADRIESIIKTNLNQSQIKWLLIVKLSLLVQFLIAVFNTTARSDFISILVPLGILIILNTGFTSNRKRFLRQFIIVCVFNILYDLFWLLFTETVYTIIILENRIL